MSTKSASAKNKTTTKVAKLDKKVMANETAKAREFTSIYHYPEDAKTPLDKKAFRRRARQEKKKLEKAVTLGKGPEKDKAKAELAKFVKKTYATPIA